MTDVLDRLDPLQAALMAVEENADRLRGAAGENGAAGANGERGDRGEPGLVWRGSWKAGAKYAPGDVVEFEGSAYVAVSPTKGVKPPKGWDILARKGEKGEDGQTRVVRTGGGSGSGLPTGGAVGQVVTNTAPGAGTWQDAAGGVANPLTADLDVGGFLVRGANLGADKGGLVQADAAVDVGQGGDVTVTGGEGNSTDGTGGEGTFEGGNGWKGGIGQLVGGASTGAGQDGANVLLTGGASFDAYGGEAQILGGTANGATGGGGDARIQGGDSQGSGVAAQIVVGGRPETSGNGLLEVKTNNSTGAASQFLGSNGSGKVVWATLAGLSGSSQTYTESNVTTDRAFNANATSIDELADVLGTLIVDLRARGVVA